MSEFYTAWFCVKCRGEISRHQKMYSYGRCPKCGFKHEDACTIVKTFERPFRYVKTYKWIPSFIAHHREFIFDGT